MKWLWLLLTVVMLIGCRTDSQPSITPNATIPTRTPIPAVDIVPANETPDLNDPTYRETAGVSSLRVWTNIRFSPDTNPLLSDQITQFGTENRIEIEVRVKDEDGLATSLNYMRTGRNIAPSLMPDLILLNDTELNSALNDELIALVDVYGVETADWYTAGQNLVISTDEQTMIGWPIAFTELHHVVWNQASFTETFTTWNEWLQTDVVIGVPVAGQAAASLALAHYTPAPNEPFDEAMMITALAQSGQAADQVLVGSPLTDGRVNGALMSANQFMQLTDTEALTPGALPTPPTAGLWLWGITTDDPERQAAVIDLLRWLMNGQNSGQLTQSLQLIPANRSALDFWTDRTYADFLTTYLADVRLRPSQLPLQNTLNLATLTMLTDPNADAAAVYQMITDAPTRR